MAWQSKFLIAEIPLSVGAIDKWQRVDVCVLKVLASRQMGRKSVRLSSSKLRTAIQACCIFIFIVLVFCISVTIAFKLGYLDEKGNPCIQILSKRRIERLQSALQIYYLDHGRIPGDKEGLEVLVSVYGFDKDELLDQWGERFKYTTTDLGHSYTLTTFGKDRVSGGECLNSDIVEKSYGKQK